MYILPFKDWFITYSWNRYSFHFYTAVQIKSCALKSACTLHIHFQIIKIWIYTKHCPAYSILCIRAWEISCHIYSFVQRFVYTFDAVWSKFDSIAHQKCIQIAGPNCIRILLIQLCHKKNLQTTPKRNVPSVSHFFLRFVQVSKT